jgi:hypothetical protein
VTVPSFTASRVPISVSTVMMTTEMSVAIRPYSIAVAPLSSFQKASSDYMRPFL